MLILRREAGGDENILAETMQAWFFTGTAPINGFTTTPHASLCKGRTISPKSYGVIKLLAGLALMLLQLKKYCLCFMCHYVKGICFDSLVISQTAFYPLSYWYYQVIRMFG